MSVLAIKLLGVNGNLDADELLVESELDLAGGESRGGLVRSSDFSDGVLR